MLEAMSKRQVYENLKILKEKQLRKLHKMNLFNINKSLSREESDLSQNFKNDIEDITKLLHLMIIRLCVSELPEFKKSRVENYDSMIQKFTEIALSGFQKLANYKQSSQMIRIE